jgi:hypothetical protein
MLSNQLVEARIREISIYHELPLNCGERPDDEMSFDFLVRCGQVATSNGRLQLRHLEMPGQSSNNPPCTIVGIAHSFREHEGCAQDHSDHATGRRQRI